MTEKKQVELVECNDVSTKVKKSRIFQYSMQLAMLQTLLRNEAVTQNEYDTIKMNLMRDYNISSNLMCKEYS